MKFLIWAILWPFIFLIGIFARLISPFACMFVTRAPYYTTVKRMGKVYALLERDRLVWWLTWLDTDDNATDEYFYGMYGATATWTQEQYDGSRVRRWLCRVLWLQRNSAYTFNRKVFGISPNSWLAWQYKAVKPIKFLWWTKNDINIGWKSHKGIDKLLYAGRIVGLRK